MKRLTNEMVRVDKSVDKYLGPLADIEGMKPKLLDLILNSPTLNGVSKDVLRQIIRQLYSELAAYEDTDREPEEVEMDHEAAEELRRLCQYCDLDRLEKLAEADKDGRVVVLPCKVGDTVWIAGSVRGVYSAKVRTFFCGHSSTTRGTDDNGNIQMIRTTECDIPIRDFGKTVFLTHEEAEQALEAKRDD